MKTQEKKAQILSAGEQKLQGVIADFEERIGELKKITTSENMEESASQSEARRDGDIEMMQTLMHQLDFAKMELETLKRINPDETHDKVDFGAVVITDKRRLFVSTGIENFEVNKEDYFGLSTQAPLYKNMAGCKKGDKIAFHGIEYQIEEIF